VRSLVQEMYAGLLCGVDEVARYWRLRCSGTASDACQKHCRGEDVATYAHRFHSLKNSATMFMLFSLMARRSSS
jgi:hypothetical protein